MPSIVPGYEYDIFISYRQNDNQSDQWVTNFVEALREEIKATFKEEISIYFDENPHNGLHEHHEVDDSLREKLKCLIFIPIVSQTYCDLKCFAWEHEFKVFIEQASKDQFGLKTKLSGGNVASRVLPVKIHDLDNEDQQLFESEVGGVLRSIDFIYKDTGVNRPLNPSDDRELNLNKTFYRDQINKVANAIKEIILGIKGGETVENQSESPTIASSLTVTKSKSKNKVLLTSIAIALILVLTFFIYNTQSNNQIIDESLEKSIAVLYFDNMSGDPEQQYFSEGMTEEIIARLVKLEGIRVPSLTSVGVFKGQTLNIKKINKIGYVMNFTLQISRW